jgi:hypothetical protein
MAATLERIGWEASIAYLGLPEGPWVLNEVRNLPPREQILPQAHMRLRKVRGAMLQADSRLQVICRS